MADKRNQPCQCGSGKRYKKCCGLEGTDTAVSQVVLKNNTAKKTFSAAEYIRLGDAAVGRRQLEEAAGFFLQAIKLQPDNPEVLNTLGVVYLTQGKLEDAAESFHQLIKLKPDHVEAYFNLGVTLFDQGKINEAIAVFRRLIALKPDHAAAHFNLGNFLMAQGNFKEAAGSFRQALRYKPDYAEAFCNLGVIFNELGNKEEAIVNYRKALSVKPDYARAFKGLSLLVKYTDIDVDIYALEELFNKRGTPEADRKDLGFALGNYYENLKEYDKAFTFYFEANRLKRKAYQYSVQKEYDFFVRIKQVFSPEFFATHETSGNQNKTPIFIVGMPRSGTSLVEQILASHPLVFGAGELGILVNLTNRFCTGKEIAQFPECMLEINKDALERMGKGYLAEIREFSEDAEYITDKMPNNFLRVGLIKTILPNAKVIHCVRNPMDTCLSIFKMDFTSPHGYAYDMVELGQYYNLYRNLMAHWEKVMPGFMNTIIYEDLVADQQRQTQSLLDFCGLPWDEACLAFYKTERRVSTASLAQIRQPIYKDSVELWKRYERQLEPLMEIIEGNKP